MNLNSLRAYLACSEEMQKHVRALLRVVDDTNADEDERFASLATIEEILYPSEPVSLDELVWDIER